MVSYSIKKKLSAGKLTIELMGREKHVYDGYDIKHMDIKHPGKVCIKKTLLSFTIVLKSFERGKVLIDYEEYPF